jgi:hypothetical protein
MGRFSDIIDKLDKLFDQVDEPDFNWRCRFSWVLYQVFNDADKKKEA